MDADFRDSDVRDSDVRDSDVRDFLSLPINQEHEDSPVHGLNVTLNSVNIVILNTANSNRNVLPATCTLFAVRRILINKHTRIFLLSFIVLG